MQYLSTVRLLANFQSLSSSLNGVNKVSIKPLKAYSRFTTLSALSPPWSRNTKNGRKITIRASIFCLDWSFTFTARGNFYHHCHQGAVSFSFFFITDDSLEARESSHLKAPEQWRCSKKVLIFMIEETSQGPFPWKEWSGWKGAWLIESLLISEERKENINPWTIFIKNFVSLGICSPTHRTINQVSEKLLGGEQFFSVVCLSFVLFIHSQPCFLFR